MTSAFSDITTVSLLFGIVMILGFALLGRVGARKLGLPTVFGELLMGILIGNLFYFWGYDLMLVLREGAGCVDIARHTLSGHSWDEAALIVLGEDSRDRVAELLRGPNGSQYLQVSQAASLYLHYGLMFVMFHIGLSTYVVAELRDLDADSVKVAVIGAFAPMLLGFAVVVLLASHTSHVGHLFIAATLGSTGIATTSQALARMRRNHSREARVVLGAATMDDVLGLIVLSIASGIVLTGSAEIADIGRTSLRAFLFLVCAFGFGPAFLKLLVWLLRHFDALEAKLFVSFILVMFLAGVATLVHLSPVVGAFAAGLLMHESHFRAWGDLHDDRHSIGELLAPLEVIVVPAFFVLMGLQVKLETLLDPGVVYVFAGLLTAAVLGKWLSGIGPRGEINRLAVGLGMMPRGEVGLAFAFIGKSLGIIDSAMFAVVVLVVIVTTLMTPPLLRLAMGGNSMDHQKGAGTR
ncbi:MAG: cation:proton antiporter [Gammaproteobacteria bacterium]|jgi:Kef-type K+ transport system membrane component KefB